MNELHLFAGAGGGILGGMLLGHTCVCAVEIEPYPRKVLLQRQGDGILPKFPIWDDIRTFDGRPWRGHVDIIAGGFPCQDISSAGKGAGIDGERSGMWVEMARVIREVRPRFVFVENSPMLTSRGLGRVLGDLAAMGYNARWGVLGACDAGAPHKRERIWILANCNSLRKLQPKRIEQDQRGRFSNSGSEMADADSRRLSKCDASKRIISKPYKKCDDMADATSERQSRPRSPWYACDPAEAREGEADRAWAERVGHIWGIESSVGRVAHGVANRVDRLKAIGNGQVPSVAALAWKILSE